ncbi:tigger transposable element-derived protein 4-like [Dermacentor silvarum]|uniref:tigger transposable element-derived protein 4-like n=1 Tax=Dermacentor silvarum TaxID=543639 RepID=UPI001896EEFA|nr:tigger transposable element-derived protein 4-like [Dermacentor silvarum]
MSSRGKYRAKTLNEKLEILRVLEAGKQSKNEIAKRYDIPGSMLSTYNQNKKTIEDSYAAETFAKDLKSLRTAKHPDLMVAMLTFIKEKRSQDMPLSGPIIVAKAANFARLNVSDFAASDGWFHHFRNRRDLIFLSVCGEAKAVDAETCTVWRNAALLDHLNRYAPFDIFNADETALFIKLLPDKTITYNGGVCAGGKSSKERVTVLLGANMTGTEKIPLFVIGKSQKLRCFRNIRTLPADYAANKKARMTGELFKQWLRKLDQKFELG